MNKPIENIFALIIPIPCDEECLYEENIRFFLFQRSFFLQFNYNRIQNKLLKYLERNRSTFLYHKGLILLTNYLHFENVIYKRPDFNLRNSRLEQLNGRMNIKCVVIFMIALFYLRFIFFFFWKEIAFKLFSIR